MKTREDIYTEVKARESEERFRHTLAVVEYAGILADCYGIDREMIWVAAMLHDIAKDMEQEEMFAVASKYGYTISELSRVYPQNMHAEIGALIAKNEFGLTDEQFLDAIRYHVFGRPAMSVPEKILMISDYTEPSRPDSAKMAYLFNIAKTDLDQAILRTVSLMIEHQEARHLPMNIREHIWESFDYLMDEKRRKKMNFPDAKSSAGLLTDEEFDAGLEVLRMNRIPVRSVHNIRRLGGFMGCDDRTVKTGMLIRSADLSRLTDEDALYLSKETGVSLVIDLRTPAEIEKAPDKMIPGAEYVKASILQSYPAERLDYLTERYANSGSEREKAWLLSEYALIPVVSSMYERMLTEEASLDTWKEIFRLIMNAKGPVLYHCTSGKDRTGMLSAMLLYVLGCDTKDIINDYNASAIALMSASEPHMELLKQYMYEDKVIHGLQSTLSVVPEVMHEGISRIEAGYKTREEFAREMLGMGDKALEELRNKYTTRISSSQASRRSIP